MQQHKLVTSVNWYVLHRTRQVSNRAFGQDTQQAEKPKFRIKDWCSTGEYFPNLFELQIDE